MTALSGGVALVTGAGSGIGQAIAVALAREDMNVCLVGRSEDKLRGTAERCEGHGWVRAYPGDITDPEFISEASGLLADDPGRLDVLVHCAGSIYLGDVAGLSIGQLDEQYRTNVWAPFALTQAVLPLLEECKGDIVMVNSSAGAATARRGQAQYAATKHALRAFTDSLRDELNPKGIRVLSVFPGRTATPMQEQVYNMEGRQYRPEGLLQPEDVAHAVISALHLSRTGEITEIHIRPMKKMG
jgi:NAD(P)-dependent dehydrogenase (short-subunit alcohol dehydrogenase family)